MRRSLRVLIEHRILVMGALRKSTSTCGPQKGTLARNADLPLTLLLKQLRQEHCRASSYIVRSVHLDHDSGTFEQHGSAPNFQGGMLTLCTCKHQMRSTRSAHDWTDTWIAGLTSRTEQFDGNHWLFYLAKVEAAYESHARLWDALPVRARNAKAAHAHYLGDVFKPKAPIVAGSAEFSPSSYVTPNLHTHRQHPSDFGWHKDIDYQHAVSHRRSPLIVAAPEQTYLWHEPILQLKHNHCRDFSKWSSLQEFLGCLRETR
jgi:hypothetical protein